MQICAREGGTSVSDRPIKGLRSRLNQCLCEPVRDWNPWIISLRSRLNVARVTQNRLIQSNGPDRVVQGDLSDTNPVVRTESNGTSQLPSLTDPTRWRSR